ncbi:hypothetical protein EF294_18600 [Gordonia oryzae]|uniref:Abortive phage infection protein C-terminal domain-containing protein n=1 Tax=Gordonia oryzae TaxID=2487349 RepID=A0A3N4G551_9ACTN|nr:AIPR family protein [Gordonia oryzae]RPA57515.1 hypothetical protein EF294_18600 [Gordonia oryzae]
MTARKVRSFARDHGLTGIDSKLFEFYVAYLYLNRYVSADIRILDDIVTGGGDDGGIDVAAVVINGTVVTDASDIADLLNDGSENSVYITLIQAKTSEKYDTKLISKFLHGVEQIAEYTANGGDTTNLPIGLSQTAMVVDEVLNNITRFNTPRIPAELFYVTNSKTSTDVEALGETQVLAALRRLQRHAIFPDDITCILQGKNDREERESTLSGPQDVTFRFPGAQPITETMGIDQAYIGVAQADQLLNVICNDSGRVRDGVLKENVRTYQGDANPVNREIYSTLLSEDVELFPFLNNGLTIIARKLNNAGGRITISSYQIVNGGQTSHQLARWAEHLRDTVGKENAMRELAKVAVPIKLISTTSSEIFSRVSVATNLQSAISETDIQSSKKHAQDVELYFAQSGPDGLRYARQNGTDLSDLDVPGLRVVTTSDLDRAVAACIFGESSTSIGSPKSLYGKSSFIWNNHPVDVYYFSALIVYRIESLFRRSARDDSIQLVKAAKYHLAMMTAGLLIPELVSVFEEEKEPTDKDIDTAAREIERAVAKSDLSDSIDNCVAIAIKSLLQHFAAQVKIGKPLVKDDVRNKSVETELHNMFFHPNE